MYFGGSFVIITFCFRIKNNNCNKVINKDICDDVEFILNYYYHSQKILWLHMRERCWSFCVFLCLGNNCRICVWSRSRRSGTRREAGGETCRGRRRGRESNRDEHKHNPPTQTVTVTRSRWGCLIVSLKTQCPHETTRGSQAASVLWRMVHILADPFERMYSYPV